MSHLQFYRTTLLHDKIANVTCHIVQLFKSRTTPVPNTAVLYSVQLCRENAVNAAWPILVYAMSCDKVVRQNCAIELQVWHQSNSIPRSFLHRLLRHRATGKKWHRFLMGLHVTNQQWRKLKAFIQPKARLSFFIHHWTPEGMLLNSCCLPNTSTNVNSRLILKVMQTCYNTQWWNFKSELCVKGLRYDTVD